MDVKNGFYGSKIGDLAGEMRIEYSTTEFMPGTTRRRMYLYEDNGDVIMTSEILYEEEEEDDSEYQYDGPVEEEDSL